MWPVVLRGYDIMTEIVSTENIRVYEMYRRRITEEDALINHRMMWMILTEAFLFSGFVIASQNSVYYLALACGAAGLLVACISYLSIRAAQSEIYSIAWEFSVAHPEVARDPRFLNLTGSTSASAASDRKKAIDDLVSRAVDAEVEKKGYSSTTPAAKPPRPRFYPGWFTTRNHILGHALPNWLPVFIALLWIAALLFGRPN